MTGSSPIGGANHLADFDPASFLADHWQKKPLLIRNAWDDWHNPLEPDELAGLACEDAVESRLVEQAGEAWQVEHGPPAEDRFGELGTNRWTLLVQAVDHHVPEVAALLEAFRFVPNWRIDDVMVSLAADGGGVGPHFDQYDVFLIQGLGRRRWQIGSKCDEASALLPHDDVRLLANFEPTDEWILEPGDMLYVPPGWSHNGVAVGDDCMTYSIGFRAPSRTELIGSWADHLLDSADDGDRYTDPDLAPQANPGEITDWALTRLQAMITEKLADPAAFALWFGRYTSTPKYPDMDWRPEEPVLAEHVRTAIEEGRAFLRNPASRCAFIAQDAGAVLLFVDGQAHRCAGDAADFARLLCAQDRFVVDAAWAVSEAVPNLLADLLNQGSVGFDYAD